MSTRSIVTSPAIAALAALVLVVGACSRDATDSADSTTSPTAPTSTTAATTTEAPITTVTESSPAASTTTEAATATTVAGSSTTTPGTTTAPTTIAPPVSETGLTLAATGVLPFVFGQSDAEVIAGLTTVLGPPDFDTAQTYPIADGDNFLDVTEEEAFVHPIGRTVCFANDLCALFGGDTVDSLTFTGWDSTGDLTPQVFTVEGITVGSMLSDFVDVVDLDVGGCYTVGYGEVAGVDVTLISAGELFGYFDEDGEYVFGDPAPTDVTVVRLTAGDRPLFLFDDC